MIEPDGPALGGRHPGQDAPCQVEPTREQSPLILTLAFAAADQAGFDRLRAAHFPPERNLVPAHATLFHHLPGSAIDAIARDLDEACRRPDFPVEVAGLRSLGRGVAFVLAAPPLDALRAGLARRWAAWLGPQDRQPYRPHVTVQNKVEPAQAASLLETLRAGFAPFTVRAEGLLLWHYRGGPWQPAGRFPFAGR